MKYMVNQNIAIYSIWLGIFNGNILCISIVTLWTTRAFVTMRNRIISVFNYNQVRKPIIEDVEPIQFPDKQIGMEK